MSRKNPRFRRINAPLPGAAGAVYQVQAQFTIDNQSCLCTFGYLANSLVQTALSEANIAVSWINNCMPALKNCLPADTIITFVKVTTVSVPSRTPVLQPAGILQQIGTVAGNHLPLEMAAIISRVTATKGQHGRGRSYLPSIPTSFVNPAVDANRLTFAAFTIYSQFATAILQPLTDGANTAALAVYTRPAGALPVTAAAVSPLVLVRTLLGTVRRRRPGRGK